MPPAADRLITPSQLALFSRSPVIGAWWEELKAQGLFNKKNPATTALEELLREKTHQHIEILYELEVKGNGACHISDQGCHNNKERHA